MGKRAGSIARRSSITLSRAVGLHAVEDRGGDGVARRELVGEAAAGASSRVAPSPRTASVISRPSKRLPGQGQRGRVELAELEVGEVGPGCRRQHRAGADRAAGVVVRRQSAAAPPVASTVAAAAADRAAVAEQPVAALAVAPQGHAEVPLADLDAGLGGDHRRQLPGDLPAGLAATGVDDAAAGVATLKAEGQLTFRVEVELDAALAQFPDRVGGLFDQDLDG